MTFPEPYHYNIWADLLDEDTDNVMVKEILAGMKEALTESLMDEANIIESMDFLKAHTPAPELAISDLYDLSNAILGRGFANMMVFLTPDHVQDIMLSIFRELTEEGR